MLRSAIAQQKRMFELSAMTAVNLCERSRDLAGCFARDERRETADAVVCVPSMRAGRVSTSTPGTKGMRRSNSLFGFGEVSSSLESSDAIESRRAEN